MRQLGTAPPADQLHFAAGVAGPLRSRSLLITLRPLIITKSPPQNGVGSGSRGATDSGGLIWFSARRFALAHGCKGAGDYAHCEEPEIHQGSRLPDCLPQHRWKLKIDHCPVMDTHQNQEEQNPHEKHRLQNLHCTHNISLVSSVTCQRTGSCQQFACQLGRTAT